ncbi:hypothetical protein EOA25_02860 [Mesorhizobium sp. M2A.F.Ca.ET.040.01.1.1]|nr:hypothetical protein EOA25_02860 [Mesorhizobium sp. M2A.F.Ca.ET.040.01.1.1]
MMKPESTFGAMPVPGRFSRYRSTCTLSAEQKAEMERIAFDALPQWAQNEIARGQWATDAIDSLRGEEGNSITFVCDNPDFNGQPNAKVICHGAWTGWADRTFTGDTVGKALAAALSAYQHFCPGHIASDRDPKVCGRCGIHIDELRPDEEDPINLAGSGPVPIEAREG